jgi:hypothetical protein
MRRGQLTMQVGKKGKTGDLCVRPFRVKTVAQGTAEAR